MRLLITSCVLFSLTASNVYAATDQSVCQQFLETMRSRTEAVFHDAHMNFMQKQSALSQLFDEGVDIGWVARTVTGSYWNSASEQDKQDFLKAYSAYLTNHYIGGLNEDDINDMQAFIVKDFTFTPPHAYESHIDIKQRADEPIDIDLRLEERPAGACHVRDFTAEGVSLISSQSDQIQALAAQGGLKSVTQKLLSLSHP